MSPVSSAVLGRARKARPASEAGNQGSGFYGVVRISLERRSRPT